MEKLLPLDERRQGAEMVFSTWKLGGDKCPPGGTEKWKKKTEGDIYQRRTSKTTIAQIGERGIGGKGGGIEGEGRRKGSRG